jgi:hypothetical protein
MIKKGCEQQKYRKRDYIITQTNLYNLGPYRIYGTADQLNVDNCDRDSFSFI